MPIRAVVLDLDGTMFDTEALFHRVAGDYLAERGKVFTPEIMRAMIGHQAPVSGLALKTMAELDGTVEEILLDLRDRFYARMDAEVQPMPGLYALLDALRERKIPHAVATSSRRAYAERILRNHRVWDRLHFVLGAEDVSQGKPEPEIYLKAADRLELPPKAILVLEDSPPGVTAAKAAGAFTVAVPHDQSPADGLGHADLLIQGLDDPILYRHLEGT